MMMFETMINKLARKYKCFYRAYHFELSSHIPMRLHVSLLSYELVTYDRATHFGVSDP